MTTVTEGFAAELRAATASGHRAAEGGAFLGALQPGTFTVADFAALTTAHLVIYRALESAIDRLSTDELIAPFAIDGLSRSARLEADVRALATLVAPAPIVPAATRYAARIQAIADEPARVVAHHYTRYLGDLSGGQMIRHRLLQLHPELAVASSFYDFPALGPLGAFKKRYRDLLDQVPGERRAAVIDEVRVAYELNVVVFIQLDELRPDHPSTA